jgi:hypothetical protein
MRTTTVKASKLGTDWRAETHVKAADKLTNKLEGMLHQHGLGKVLDVLADMVDEYAADIEGHDNIQLEVSSMDHVQWQVTAQLLRNVQRTVAQYETADVPF